jgi:hypothetical protein
VSAGRVEVLWKQPILPSAGPDLALRLPLEARFVNRCTVASWARPELTESVLLERWVVTCGETGLQGASVEIIGLPRTLIDVPLRVRWLDGSVTDHLLRPEAPRVTLSDGASAGLGVPAYPRLGVDHLLLGFDHILFVVGLMFFVSRPRQQGWVDESAFITTFMPAHRFGRRARVGPRRTPRR